MKLVRLTSNDNEGRFETFFKTNIEIKEKSQVALQNISFTSNAEGFKVNGVNGLITFTIDGNVMIVKLTEANYSINDYGNLFFDIQDKLNDKLDFTSVKMIGLQFSCSLNRDGKIEITYNISPYELESYYWNEEQLSLFPSGTTHIHSNIIGVKNDDSSNYYSTLPFIKGCGVMRASLFTYADTGADGEGLFVGMSRETPSTWTSPIMTDLQKDMYLHLDNGKYKYQYYTGGTKVQGENATLPEVGDIVEISRRGGFFVGGFYRSGTFTQVFNIPDDNTSLYYPYLIFRSGSTQLIVEDLIVQLNPEHFSTYAPPLKKDRIQTNLGVVPIPSPQVIVSNILNFNEKSMLDYLGFENITYTILSATPKFIAEEAFSLSVFNDTYILVLDNMELESYDGFDGVRKSILSVIPYSDDNTNRVVQYEPANINFIDLKNIKPQSLRSIKGRILTSNLKTPSLNGLISITLLIK
tara:strand:+ start:10863 stop:12266 length:1404 start_codon:yes stop_codon:yes gene_type:complete